MSNYDMKVDESKVVQTSFVTTLYDEYLTSYHLKKNFRTYKHFHPSEMGGCIRKAVALMLDVPGDFYTHGRAQRTFANGHKTHDRLQADMGDMGILLGYWKCVACGHVMGREERHGIKKPSDCSKCHKPAMSRPVTDDDGNVRMPARPIFDYKEIAVKHPTLNISGHCDGIIDTGSIKFIIDYKTIESNQFDNIVDRGVPHDKYIAQINQYMDILEVPLGLIFYENSNNKKTTEFFLKPDPVLLESIYAKVAMGQEYADRGELPPIPHKYALNPANHDCMGFPGYPPCPFLRACFPAEFAAGRWEEKLAKFNKMV